MTFYRYIIKYNTLLMYNIRKGKLLQTAFDDVEGTKKKNYQLLEKEINIIDTMTYEINPLTYEVSDYNLGT